MRDIEIALPDGRTLHAYDSGNTDHFPIFWHHGTPNIGEPPQPLFEIATRLGIRWVSYDRPGYGGSSRCSGRTIASAADDTRAVADALGLGAFAVMGHSGGAPHALACAALLPNRVVGAACVATLAPYGATELDWFEGMNSSGVASLTAAVAGLEEKQRFETSGAEYDPEFTPADRATLSGMWRWLGTVAGHGLDAGLGGLIDDDLAYVGPWGFDPTEIVVPLLLLHGSADTIAPASHSQWLAKECLTGELWLRPGEGHISVLNDAEKAVEWLVGKQGQVPSAFHGV